MILLLGRILALSCFSLAWVMTVMASGKDDFCFFMTVSKSRVIILPRGFSSTVQRMLLLTIRGNRSDATSYSQHQHTPSFRQDPVNDVAYLAEYLQHVALGVAVDGEGPAVEMRRLPEAFALQIRLRLFGDADHLGDVRFPRLYVGGDAESELAPVRLR